MASNASGSLGCAVVRRHAGERAGQRLGRARQLVDDAADALAREQRDRVLLGAVAALDVHRLPVRVLVLGEAARELARLADRGAVDLAGPAAADVADHELERPPDRRVGAVARARAR